MGTLGAHVFIVCSFQCWYSAGRGVEDWTLLVIVAVVVGSLNGEYTNVFRMKTKDYVVPSIVG